MNVIEAATETDNANNGNDIYHIIKNDVDCETDLVDVPIEEYDT